MLKFFYLLNDYNNICFINRIKIFWELIEIVVLKIFGKVWSIILIWVIIIGCCYYIELCEVLFCCFFNYRVKVDEFYIFFNDFEKNY